MAWGSTAWRGAPSNAEPSRGCAWLRASMNCMHTYMGRMHACTRAHERPNTSVQPSPGLGHLAKKRQRDGTAEGSVGAAGVKSQRLPEFPRNNRVVATRHSLHACAYEPADLACEERWWGEPPSTGIGRGGLVWRGGRGALRCKTPQHQGSEQSEMLRGGEDAVTVCFPSSGPSPQPGRSVRWLASPRLHQVLTLPGCLPPPRTRCTAVHRDNKPNQTSSGQCWSSVQCQ